MSINVIALIFFILFLFFFLTTVILKIRVESEQNKNLYIQGQLNPFKRKNYFLTGNEIKLFEILQNIKKLNEFYVFPQLHLATLFEVKEDVSDMAGKFDRINTLYVDFIIFDKEFSPKLVIELNDTTHKLGSRKARDQFVEKVCTDNKIELYTLSTIDLSKPDMIEQKIIEYLG